MHWPSGTPVWSSGRCRRGEAPGRGAGGAVSTASCEAACGIAMLESPDGDRPGALPCQLLDHGTGYLAAAAAIEGVRRQSRAGGTHTFDLSLAATAAWLLTRRSAAPPTTTVTPAQLPPNEWLTTLQSDRGPVTTITPPGSLDHRPLRWPEHMTTYGQDPPSW